jgi:hypothetical protein
MTHPNPRAATRPRRQRQAAPLNRGRAQLRAELAGIARTSSRYARTQRRVPL